MGKSLGEYTISKASSKASEIKWTKKNPVDHDKPKRKKRKNTSPTNVIQSSKVVEPVEKVYTIEETEGKKKHTRKRFEKSSASNCLVGPSYKRPGR